MKSKTNPRVHITTLGCAKNQVDSEKVAAMLDQAGYRMANDVSEADVAVVNTCAFIEPARAESVETILEVDAARNQGAGLLVIGCMAQRFGGEIEEALPEVDAVVGLDRYGELVSVLDSMTGWSPVRLGPRRSHMDILDLVNRPTPTLPYAYVKVAEGCNKTCSFCAIPLIRGKQRSRRPISIRDEIRGLCDAGVSEVILVSQDLAAYGRDLRVGTRETIVDLLRFVSDVDGLKRIRLLYLYPSEIRPRLIEEIASNRVIAPYFDLSLQHASRRLLKMMRRPGSTERHLGLISRIRDVAPEAALRSSFIVGFPGETEDDVEELVEFLRAARLDRAGFFPYSPESGTGAVELGGRIGAGEVIERVRELTRVQDEITACRNADQLGRRHHVLVDQVEDGVPVGRSYREAPDIDGIICLDVGAPGDWLEVEITGSYETDLVGTVISAPQSASVAGVSRR